MKLFRIITLAVTLAVPISSIALGGCSGAVEQQPQTSASALTKAPVGANTRGVVRMVADALAEVPLRADQRATVELLLREADERHAPLADRKNEVVAALADQIESGAVDRAALQPLIDRGVADLESVRAADRAAIEKLHALLDPEQRGAFVDALEAQMKSRHGGVADRVKGLVKMKELADELKLTDEQRSQVHGLVRDAMKDAWTRRRGEGHDGPPPGFEGKRPHRPSHDNAKRALEAFRGDTLDLDKVAPQRDMKKMADFGAERMSAIAAKILPILTPEQRKLAAARLRAHAATADSGDTAAAEPL